MAFTNLWQLNLSFPLRLDDLALSMFWSACQRLTKQLNQEGQDYLNKARKLFLAMIDQFLIFDPSGTVHFNYQPEKNYARVVNAFINDVLINERKMRYVEGSELADTTNKNSEQSANAAAEAEANAALVNEDKDDDNEEEDDDDEKEDNADESDDDNGDKAGTTSKRKSRQKEDEEEIQKHTESDIDLGSYSFDGHNLKYLIWTDDSSKSKVYFTMIYPSLVTIKKPYEFLKNIKILYENSSSDMNKFEKFFNISLNEIGQVLPSPEAGEAKIVETKALTGNIKKKEAKDSKTTNGKKSQENGMQMAHFMKMMERNRPPLTFLRQFPTHLAIQKQVQI